MRSTILSIIIFLSVNMLGQEMDNLKAFDILAKDSIFEMPMYIPILESENDSISYGYKIIILDTMALDMDNSTILEKEKPFTPQKVTKPSFHGGEHELLKFIDYLFKPIYNNNLQRDKKYRTGYTTVRFKVTKIGHVLDPVIIKSCSPEYDEEIKKIIRRIPTYIPSRARTPEFYCLLSIAYPIENK